MTTAKTISNERLAPVVAWARGGRGRISRLVAAVQEITGEKTVNRHMVSRWLAEDPEASIQPSHGYGIAIEQAYLKLCAEDQD
jgi:hypothetical protein